MFEVIETQQIFNRTFYRAKTTQGVSWYFFKGAEIKQYRFLKYHRNYQNRMIAPVCCFCDEDWKDIKEFIKTLN